MIVQNLKIKGSSDNDYDVVIKLDGTNLTASCNCKAGEVGQYCKHRISVLSGDFSNIIDGKTEELESIVNQVKNTDVGKALAEVEAIELEIKNLQSKLKRQKKVLAKAMKD